MPYIKENTLAYHLEKKVIKALTIQSHTTRELSGLLDANYYTIRKVLQKFEDEGIIRHSSFRGSARVFSLAAPGQVIAKESIPSIIDQSGKKLKMVGLLGQVGMENTMVAGKAATALPRNMARIFMAALRYDESKGEYPVGNDLSAIRTELENNLTQLEFIVKIYKAILNSDAFWDSTRLRNVPHDVDFDREAVVKAYQHYYPDN